MKDFFETENIYQMQNIYNNLSPHDKLIFGTVKWEINPPTIPYVLPETQLGEVELAETETSQETPLRSEPEPIDDISDDERVVLLQETNEPEVSTSVVVPTVTAHVNLPVQETSQYDVEVSQTVAVPTVITYLYKILASTAPVMPVPEAIARELDDILVYTMLSSLEEAPKKWSNKIKNLITDAKMEFSEKRNFAAYLILSKVSFGDWLNTNYKAPEYSLTEKMIHLIQKVYVITVKCFVVQVKEIWEVFRKIK